MRRRRIERLRFLFPPESPSIDSRKARVMTKRRTTSLVAAGLGLALLSGCQTWNTEAGLTLPSPYYLRHAPQYFPPSPPYPLQKELNALEDASRQNEENQRAPG